MAELDNEITITIPLKQATRTHIEQLEASLTKRNAEIERLTGALERAEAAEPYQHKLDAAFKRGWKAAAEELMDTTQRVAQELGKLRKDAWAIYLQSEKRDK